VPYPPDRRRGALRLIPPARSRHAAVCTKARALLQERIMHLVNMRTEMSWDILNRNRVLSKTTESQKTQLQGIMMERAWRGCRPPIALWHICIRLVPRRGAAQPVNGQ
jgi:hypothetical protein